MSESKRIITLFRMGDFYEAFNDDAVTVAKELGLTIVNRSRRPLGEKMCGFPYHQVFKYVEQLKASGYEVVVKNSEGEVILDPN